MRAGWIAALLLVGCMPPPSADLPPLAEAPSCAPEEAAFVYRRRIEPLIADGRAPSCNRCHLQGIDLSAFVRDTPCKSMACLVSKDMVDLEAPEDSRILSLIDRARGGPTPAIAEEEHAGFLAWIRYSARCHAEACGEVADPCALPPDAAIPDDARDAGLRDAAPPPDRSLAMDAGVDADAPDLGVVDAQVADVRRLPLVPDHLEPCSPGQLVTQFQMRVMPWRSRCHHCHADDGLTRGIRGAPLWMVDRPDFEAARQTAERVLRSGYIDPAEPAQSLFVLKPLHRRYGGVEHGGGNKFTSDTDPAYRDFLSWAEAIGRCGVPDLAPLAAPDVGVVDAGTQDGGVDPPDATPDADRPTPLRDYCECMLARCHDTYHRLWGEDDATAGVVCLQRAARLDEAVRVCRQTVCEAAPLRPDGSEEPVLCAGAVGDGLCE